MSDDKSANPAPLKLHEMSFDVRVAAQVNVNGIEPQLVMAWFLHHADMHGARDPDGRKKFLDAARILANIYAYMPMARRVLAAPDLVKEGHHS